MLDQSRSGRSGNLSCPLQPSRSIVRRNRLEVRTAIDWFASRSAVIIATGVTVSDAVNFLLSANDVRSPTVLRISRPERLSPPYSAHFDLTVDRSDTGPRYQRK